VQVLARTPITPKHHLYVVRLHHKLLLLADSPAGLQRLDCIDEPADVSHILEHHDPTEPDVDSDESRRLLAIIQNEKRSPRYSGTSFSSPHHPSQFA
jgi:flagellar biogenesis protein FliO